MTDLQKQCYLAALEYYPYKNIDGIWGPQSGKATEKFQKAYGLFPDGIFGPATEQRIREVIGNNESPDEETEAPGTGTFWDHIKYWSREEFRCRCGGKYCNGFPVEPQQLLVELADNVREHFGKPGHRSSGIRCEIHNANEDGVWNSRHLYGKALDFMIEGNTSAQTLAYVQSLPGVRYAYAIDGSYIHMDIE